MNMAVTMMSTIVPITETMIIRLPPTLRNTTSLTTLYIFSVYIIMTKQKLQHLENQKKQKQQ